jgi:hypothetical protein
MITIDGLTQRQKSICELLWSCTDLDSVRTLVSALPLRDRQDAQTIVTLMTQDSIEQELGLDQYKAQAQLAIAQAQL